MMIRAEGDAGMEKTSSEEQLSGGERSQGSEVRMGGLDGQTPTHPV